jgi:hypothetical protein
MIKVTHYVTNQKLTLQILKEISDCKDVLEITGEYSGSWDQLGQYMKEGIKHIAGCFNQSKEI